MDDPKHSESCMCDACIRFQELVEAGEAEYEGDALRAEIAQLKATIAQVAEEERERIRKRIAEMTSYAISQGVMVDASPERLLKRREVLDILKPTIQSSRRG